MKRPDLLNRKRHMAKQIASRCAEIDVAPPAWVRHLLTKGLLYETAA